MNTPNQSHSDYPAQFRILFNKVQEITLDNNAAFVIQSQIEQTMPSSIEEIKKIVEVCNTTDPYTTFTRS